MFYLADAFGLLTHPRFFTPPIAAGGGSALEAGDSEEKQVEDKTIETAESALSPIALSTMRAWREGTLRGEYFLLPPSSKETPSSRHLRKKAVRTPLDAPSSSSRVLYAVLAREDSVDKVDWLVGLLVDWLIGWLVGCESGSG
jgi:hypothetical protein